MTDTTDLPHSRACGINCNGHGAACSRDCPTCAGHPDWTPDGLVSTAETVGRIANGRVRATLAVEGIDRLLPKRGMLPGWSSPATSSELADVLETLRGVIAGLLSRAAEAETERDAYREAIAGGRALLGMVLDVPVVVDHEPVACRADQFCEASAHYIACPSYTNSAGH